MMMSTPSAVSLSDYEEKSPSPLPLIHIGNVMREIEEKKGETERNRHRQTETEKLSYFKPMRFGCIFLST